MDNIESLEKWATGELVDGLYPTTLYNGNTTDWRDQLHQAITRDYIRVTQPRIRQLRVKPS